MNETEFYLKNKDVLEENSSNDLINKNFSFRSFIFFSNETLIHFLKQLNRMKEVRSNYLCKLTFTLDSINTKF